MLQLDTPTDLEDNIVTRLTGRPLTNNETPAADLDANQSVDRYERSRQHLRGEVASGGSLVAVHAASGYGMRGAVMSAFPDSAKVLVVTPLLMVRSWGQLKEMAGAKGANWAITTPSGFQRRAHRIIDDSIDALVLDERVLTCPTMQALAVEVAGMPDRKVLFLIDVDADIHNDKSILTQLSVLRGGEEIGIMRAVPKVEIHCLGSAQALPPMLMG